jgi:FkbM family methyltransferase
MKKATEALAIAKKYGKAVIRELVPPVFARIIRSAMPLHRADPGRLGIEEYRKDFIRLSTGRTLWHRGSRADLGVIRQIFEQRDYDLRRLARFEQIQAFYNSCPEPVIIDCGANIGASCIWFTHAYPRSKIVAIEPDADNFSLLERNCIGERVTGYHGAIASKPGMLALVDPGNGEWGYQTSEQDEHAIAKVRAYSIDELLKNQPGIPFILKIDIEGAEQELFSNPSRDIDRFPIVIIELHDWMFPAASTSKPFLTWHVSHNRDFVHYGENIFSISNDFLPLAVKIVPEEDQSRD